MPTNGLPVRAHATPVVPEPMNGSRTAPPSGTMSPISSSNNATGFSFGWTSSLLPTFMHDITSRGRFAGNLNPSFVAKITVSCEGPKAYLRLPMPWHRLSQTTTLRTVSPASSSALMNTSCTSHREKHARHPSGRSALAANGIHQM